MTGLHDPMDIERETLPDTGKTLVENAYATLRSEIVAGAFAPGAKLRTEELRTRYNISGSTMREALTRLLGEALVTSEGQRGFRVAPASMDDFEDLTGVRKLIELEALRQSIEAGDENWESQIVASFYRLSKVEERLAGDPVGASPEFERHNREFHNALIAACPSRWLHFMVGLLFQHSERYRRMSITQTPTWGAGKRDVHAEHKAIFDAVLRRDADLACGLLADHIDRTVMVLRKVLDPSHEPPRCATKAAARKKTKA